MRAGLTVDQALAVVAEGRSYTREHFPVGSPGKYVGHTPADTFDAAIDVLVEGMTEARKIAYRGDCDACGAPDDLLAVFMHEWKKGLEHAE